MAVKATTMVAKCNNSWLSMQHTLAVNATHIHIHNITYFWPTLALGQERRKHEEKFTNIFN
jgi:hypothetical protein